MLWGPDAAKVAEELPLPPYMMATLPTSIPIHPSRHRSERINPMRPAVASMGDQLDRKQRLIASKSIDAMGVAANQEISRALSQGALGARAAPRTEPGLVAAVHLRSIWAIAHAWSGHLAAAGLRMTMTGVFCHQSPMVIFKGKNGHSRRCELADLLIVVDARTRLASTRKAVLVQAKMAASAGTVSPTGISSLTQLELYQDWPLFDFEQTAYGLSCVDLKLGTDGALSGVFGVIDRHWHRSVAPRWTQHPAAPTPRRTRGFPELGDFLANMVADTPSYGRNADLRTGTPWSKMIEALLKENRKRSFRHTQSLGQNSYPRSLTAMAFMQGGLPSFQTFSGGGAPPDGAVVPLDEGPTGISAIHIQVHEA